MIPSLTFPGQMMPGQLAPKDTAATVLGQGECAGHVQNRDPFGHADDEPDAGVGRLHDRVSGEGRRHVYDRRVRSALGNRIGNGVKNRHDLAVGPLKALAGLPGVTPATT